MWIIFRKPITQKNNEFFIQKIIIQKINLNKTQKILILQILIPQNKSFPINSQPIVKVHLNYTARDKTISDFIVGGSSWSFR